MDLIGWRPETVQRFCFRPAGARCYNHPMRSVTLFRAEPYADPTSWSPSRACAFVDDPVRAGLGEGDTLLAVSVPAEQLATLRRSGTHGYMVPAAIARDAEPIDKEGMEMFMAMRDAYDEAKAVRRSMGLTKVDCAVPGEMSPVARLLWRHLPEAAARVGVNVPEGEGGSILEHLERDMERARPVASYLACREDAAFLAKVCDGTAPAVGVMRTLSGAARAVHARRAASQDVGR